MDGIDEGGGDGSSYADTCAVSTVVGVARATSDGGCPRARVAGC